MKHLLFLLSVGIFLVFHSCSKDKDPATEQETPAERDATMTEILSVVSEAGKRFMDITPIPVQSELYDYAEADTNFKAVIESIDRFNDLLNHPGLLLGISKKSLNSGSWVLKSCTEIGSVATCIWELDKGKYIYRVVQTNESSTGSVILETFISGTYDGLFYGEFGKKYYLISEFITTFFDLQVCINLYFMPTHEEVKGKRQYTFLMVVGEGRTIYTPWGGQELIMDVIYHTNIYTWSSIIGHHEWISTNIHWEGDVVSTIRLVWCASHQSLRKSYASTYNFDKHEGAWCTFDCDENVISCHDY